MNALPFKGSMCPFWEKRVTLSRVRDRCVAFEYSKGGKIEMLRSAQSTDIFFVAWTGQWRTDLFVLTEEDLKRLHHESITK